MAEQALLAAVVRQEAALQRAAAVVRQEVALQQAAVALQRAAEPEAPGSVVAD